MTDVEEFQFSKVGLVNGFLRLLGIKKGEQARVGWMFLYSVLAVGGLVITGSVVGRSLFLAALPKSAIPLKFILPPLVTVGVAAFYSRIAPKFRTDRLILGLVIVTTVVLAGFRAGLSTPVGDHLVFLCALFIFFDVAVSLGMLQFWTLAGELFNPTEAKRVFAIIASGGTVSSIVFGTLLRHSGAYVASRDLIFLILACLGGMAFIAHKLGKSFGDRLEPEECKTKQREETSSVTESIKALVSDPLVLGIAVLVVIVSQVSCVIDYQFDLAIQSEFGSNSQKMVTFLGSLRLWTGLAAAVVQLFLASRLLAKFGLRAALLVLPLALGTGTIAIILSGGVLWAVLVPRATDLVLKYTINQTASALLYLPVDPAKQRRAKVLISGMLNPLLVSFLGVSFYLADHYFSLPLVGWSVVTLLLVALWVYTVLRTYHDYIKSLQTNIRKRSLKTNWDTRTLIDSSTGQVLARNLQSSDPRAVIHTLDLMGQLEELDWAPDIESVLNHRNEEVRRRAVLLVAELKLEELAPLVAQRLEDDSQRVAASAVQAFCALQGEDSIELISPLLSSPSLEIRAAAVTGLIRFGGLDGILFAAEPLKRFLENENTTERVQGARILGELEAKSFHRPVLSLLQDPHPSVRLAATEAAGKLGHRTLVPPLIEKLIDTPVRAAAIRALGRCLGDDVSLLTLKLNDPDTTERGRLAVLRVFEKQETQLAAEALWTFLPNSFGGTRTAACHALIRLEQKNIRPRGLSAKSIKKLISDELQSAYELTRLFPKEFRDGLVDRALKRRFRLVCERMLAMLALLYPEISLSCMKASIYQSDDRLRAYAIELLDNVLSPDLREIVLPLFSSTFDELRLMSLDPSLDPPTRLQRLHALLKSDDWWLKTCAMHELHEVGDKNDIPCVLGSLESDRLIERDTAWWTLHKLADQWTFDHHREEKARALNGTNFLDCLNSESEDKMPLSDLEELLFLRTVPLFSELSDEDLIDIIPFAEEIHFEKGDYLIKMGEEGDCLFIVVEGTVKIVVEGEKSSICETPETIGELSILSDKPRSADCIAQSKVVAMKLTKTDFWALLDEQPEIAKGVIRTLLKYIS